MIGRLLGLTSGDARRRAAELLDRFDLTDAGRRRVATYSRGACGAGSTAPPAWSAGRRARAYIRRT